MSACEDALGVTSNTVVVASSFSVRASFDSRGVCVCACVLSASCSFHWHVGCVVLSLTVGLMSWIFFTASSVERVRVCLREGNERGSRQVVTRARRSWGFRVTRAISENRGGVRVRGGRGGTTSRRERAERCFGHAVCAVCCEAFAVSSNLIFSSFLLLSLGVTKIRKISRSARGADISFPSMLSGKLLDKLLTRVLEGHGVSRNTG